MNLTPREREILRLHAQGHANRMIAHKLGISSVITVSDTIASIYGKIGATDRESASQAWARQSAARS